MHASVAKKGRVRALRPAMEGLEDRKLLYATLGGSFAYGSRITYSLVPDGTNIGGTPSALYSSMASKGISAAQVQATFQKAAAAWQAAANINLVLVPDDGSSLGAAGNQQGDSRFGDIRIGGSALAAGVLATAFLPPAFNGGTLAGDVVINTTQPWKINSDYDLQTVAMHEIGHSLGLDHSAIANADMYASYNGKKQDLTADDKAGIQAVFGTRAADAFDAGSGNNTSATATAIATPLANGTQASLASLDITSSSDADWFVVTAPAGTSGTLTVTMQSSELSSLSPKVLLYNGSLQGITSAAAPNAFGATVTVTTGGVTPGQRFYIKAMAANGGSTGVGRYGLQVSFGGATMPAIAPPNTTVASAPDQGGGGANQGAGGIEIVRVGSLSAKGDSLSAAASYRRAVDFVVAGWVPVDAFDSDFQTRTIRTLAKRGYSAPDNEAGRAIRSAIIQAIAALLDEWE